MILAGIAWIMCALIKETYAPSILKRKAAKMRKETGDDRYWCRYDNHMSRKVITPYVIYSRLIRYSGTTFQSQLVTTIRTIIHGTYPMVLECLYCGILNFSRKNVAEN
jgi:hypothetical protein